MIEYLKKLNAIWSALLLTALFYEKSLGLNLLIYEVAYLIYIIWDKKVNLKNRNHQIYGSIFILSGIFTVINYSPFTYFMHFIAAFAFVGVLLHAELKSIVNIFLVAGSHIFGVWASYRRQLHDSKIKIIGFRKIYKTLAIIIIPLIIIYAFLLLYRRSNPLFDELAAKYYEYLNEWAIYISENLNWQLLWIFLVSLLVSIFLLVKASYHNLSEFDATSSDILLRKRKNSRISFGKLSLLNEYKAGIFLLAVLNALLLIVNIIDIRWVWFGFEWDGKYLKQFVHEGTYLLIISILISIAIVLYYFRGNLNFYSRNKMLRYLSYMWLAQNAVLSISVAIRNYWYIEYFALAYKRIGVFIFLILTLYGLYTVFVKVYKIKSGTYLYRKNVFSIFIVLVFSSFVNWDLVIAKYNFRHAETSFLHLDFMATLPYKTLAELNVPLEELMRLDSIQKVKFPFEDTFMTPERYKEIVANKIQIFTKAWEEKTLLEWNLAEYKAYKQLQSETH